MGKGTGSKLDTIINIEINKNPAHVVIPESLQNVEWIQLEYFKLANLADALFPPSFLYLEIMNIRERPRLLANVIRDGDWTATTHNHPTSNHYPLCCKNEINGWIAGDPTATKVVHGKQTNMAFLVEDFGRLSDFTIRILGEDQQPIAFDTETIAQLLFRVHYQGKRNLDPSEQVSRYSKLHN